MCRPSLSRHRTACTRLLIASGSPIFATNLTRACAAGNLTVDRSGVGPRVAGAMAELRRRSHRGQWRGLDLPVRRVRESSCRWDGRRSQRASHKRSRRRLAKEDEGVAVRLRFSPGLWDP